MRKLTTFVLMAILMLALASCGEGPERTLYLDKKCPQENASTGISPQTGAVDPNLKPDSYVAVVPQRLRRGYTEQISISLFNGDRPACRQRVGIPLRRWHRDTNCHRRSGGDG